MGHYKVTMSRGTRYKFKQPVRPSVRMEHVTLTGDVSSSITVNLQERTYLFTYSMEQSPS